mmetsp:Transcript_50981/g.75649  ORF Transcript_50981/g.75649 Transcript_50981/m.75649 type:complete len:100 (-) Transcript_50981:229-528(-)
MLHNRLDHKPPCTVVRQAMNTRNSRDTIKVSQMVKKVDMKATHGTKNRKNGKRVMIALFRLCMGVCLHVIKFITCYDYIEELNHTFFNLQVIPNEKYMF